MTENCGIQVLVLLAPKLYPFYVFGILQAFLLGLEQTPPLILSKF